MRGSMHNVEALLRAAVGATVVRVRRGHYVAPGGAVAREEGFIELWLDDGRCYWMGVSAGAWLAIAVEPWVDAFLPPLSPENAEWVREHGKWTAFDVSGDNEYAGVAGATVVSVEPVREPCGEGATCIRGAAFCFSTRTLLTVLCEWDETLVTVLRPSPP